MNILLAVLLQKAFYHHRGVPSAHRSAFTPLYDRACSPTGAQFQFRQKATYFRYAAKVGKDAFKEENLSQKGFPP